MIKIIKPIDKYNNELNTAYKKSIKGYLYSLIMTIVAYLIITNKGLVGSGWAAVILLSLLATSQLIFQLKYFLHLNQDNNRQRLVVFILMLLIVVIIVGGSIWIMYNLNTHTMFNYHQMLRYMTQQSGL